MFVLTADGKTTVPTEKELTVAFEEHRDHGDRCFQLHGDDGAYLSAIGEGFGPYTLEWFPREKTGTHPRAAEPLKESRGAGRIVRLPAGARHGEPPTPGMRPRTRRSVAGAVARPILPEGGLVAATNDSAAARLVLEERTHLLPEGFSEQDPLRSEPLDSGALKIDRRGTARGRCAAGRRRAAQRRAGPWPGPSRGRACCGRRRSGHSPGSGSGR